jgi:D-arabinose 1-dehydrogenase-like Zn-dependent alcohol dehydrogenase
MGSRTCNATQTFIHAKSFRIKPPHIHLTREAKYKMAKMKVAQVSKAKGDFEIGEREIPSPGPGPVRIKVQACGVCHSDLYTKEGLWPGLQFPRIPGHEVAEVIDQVGSGVTTWKKSDRAGVGWHGGQDNT